MSPTFAQLGVPDSITRALDARGITQPFAIQAATIADALEGRDVCGRAPTGSGKTLAFGIPLVHMVPKGQARRPRGLVLAPTRELADQIATELRTFAGSTRIGVVYGGVGYGPQIKALRKGVEIVVGCPGRLEDLIEQGEVALDDVEIVVVDEADRMADMGFMPAVRRLLDQTADERQTVLFSATLDGDVAQLTARYQTDPVRHEVGSETPDITAASHVFWKVDRAARIDLTAEAVTAVWPAIIFCRTRHGSDRLAKQLGKRGVKAAAIHGGRSQAQRTRALNDFAKNKVEALVATDVAARGIHVDGVAAVVQFDPPEDHKTYIHRAGRTARAGEGGLVVSLIQPDQVKETRRMQRRADIDSPITEPEPTALLDLAPPAPRRTPSVAGDRDEAAASRPTQSPHRRHNGANKDGRRSQNKARTGNTANKAKSKHRNGSARKPKQASSGSARNSSKSARSGSPSNHTKPGGSSQGSNKRKNSGSKPKAAASHRAGNGTGPGGRPNRKARRAHLQRPR